MRLPFHPLECRSFHQDASSMLLHKLNNAISDLTGATFRIVDATLGVMQEESVWQLAFFGWDAYKQRSWLKLFLTNDAGCNILDSHHKISEKRQ